MGLNHGGAHITVVLQLLHRANVGYPSAANAWPTLFMQVAPALPAGAPSGPACRPVLKTFFYALRGRVIRQFPATLADLSSTSKLGIIIVTPRYFFDVPVYRLPEERYYRERDKSIESAIYPEGSPSNEAMRAKEAADPNHNIAFRDHLQRTYGGCWRFNEIIGYIRLHQATFSRLASSRRVLRRSETEGGPYQNQNP